MLWEGLQAAGRTDIELDVESYTVELGSIEAIDPMEMDRDADRILNYLKHKKMISGDASLPSEAIQCCDMKDYITYFAPTSGLVIFPHEPGALLKKGQTVGQVLTMRNFHDIDKPDEAITPILMREDGILITRRCSPIVFEGQELFKIMTNFKRIAP